MMKVKRKNMEMITMQAGSLLLIRCEWNVSRHIKKSIISNSAIRC